MPTRLMFLVLISLALLLSPRPEQQLDGAHFRLPNFSPCSAEARPDSLVIMPSTTAAFRSPIPPATATDHNLYQNVSKSVRKRVNSGRFTPSGDPANRTLVVNEIAGIRVNHSILVL